MENRSRLPGEPSLDHPGVPTGRRGHRAGMKPLCGISSRLFWCLPALPRKCSDSRVGASSPGKCRSPQTAPRLWRPYLGSIEPSRSPEVMLDAFRAILTGPESCLLQLRPYAHTQVPASELRSAVPKWGAAAARLPSRDHIRTIRATGRSANRDGPLVQPAAADPIRMGQMQQVALIATCLPMSAIAGEPSGMMYELRAGRLACVAQVQ